MVPKLGACCGISGSNLPIFCTNPLCTVSPSRLSASQWDESAQTGPRRHGKARRILDADWKSQGTLERLDQLGGGTQASQEDHPEGTQDL